MSRLPRLTARQIIAALKRAGFEVIRIKGSHHYLQHPDSRSTVVPVHAGEAVGAGLMSKILDDCEMSGSGVQGISVGKWEHALIALLISVFQF